MTLLLDVALRSSAPMVIALLLHVVVGRRSAALRHAVLAAGLLAAIAVAPLTVLMPSWDVTIPVASQALPDATRPTIATATPGTFAAATAGAGAADSGVTAAVPATTTGPRLDAESVVLGLWLTGLLLAFARLFSGLARLARLSRAATVDADGDSLRLLQRLTAAHGITRRVVLLTTTAAGVLGTWGLFRPVVLLPTQAHGWSRERLQVALSHELAHIRRGDWPLQVAADVVCALFWFNPLCWLLAARLRREAEFACDDAVLDTGDEAPAYASHLLDIARACCAPAAAHLPATPVARPSTLEGRITAMLDTHRNRQTLSRPALAGVVLTLIAIAVPSASFTLSAQAPGPGGLTGYVYDNTGAILPGVEIELDGGRDARRSAVTDGTGRFAFDGVLAGNYVLEARLPGFRTLRNEFALAAPADWSRNITMQVGELQETVSVTAKRPAQAVPLVQAASRQRPVRVGGVIKVPRKVTDAHPVYPAELQDASLEGIVPIDALIGRDGTVTSVRVLTAEIHPAFARAAEEAVRRWVFTPTLLNGAPVEVQMGVTIRFSLED